MVLCSHHAFHGTDCPLPSIYPSSLLLWLLFACCALGRFLFYQVQTDVVFWPFPSTCTTQSFDLPIFSDHCSCSDSNKFSHTTTVGPSSFPKNLRSPRLASWKNREADTLTASSSSLLALLIYYSARSINHVGNPYPAFFFSCVRLVLER